MINLILLFFPWSFLPLNSFASNEVNSIRLGKGEVENASPTSPNIILKPSGEIFSKTDRNDLRSVALFDDEVKKVNARNEYLIQQRIGLIGGSGVLILILSFFYVTQMNRSKKQFFHLKEENFRLLHDQKEKLEQGRNLEKERVSKELHDGILGSLFGVRFLLSNLNDRTDLDSIEIRKKYLEDLKSIEEEIRNISHDIRPQFLVSQKSFVQHIKDFLKEQKNINGFEYFLQEDRQINWQEIGEHTRLNLFRIIQEAIHNSAKYSTATRISIIFKKIDGNIQMLVSDNGHGFDVHHITKGIGLKNIEARVNKLEGKMALYSNRNGTRIKVGVPSKSEDIYG